MKSHTKVYTLNTIIVFIISIISIETSISQERVFNGTVLSKKDSLAIPYANVQLTGTRKGAYTDDKGIFEVLTTMTDSLSISAIGYVSSTIPASLTTDTIYLTPKVEVLEEIVIHGKNFRSKNIALGYTQNKDVGSFTGILSGVRYIENPFQQDLIINEVYTKISRVKWIYENKPEHYNLLIRLVMFEINNKGKVGTSCLKESIELSINPKQENVYFDLSKNNIILSKKGAFIGVEFLGYYINDTFIPFSSFDERRSIQYKLCFNKKEPNKQLSFYKKDFSNEWKSINGGYNFNVGIKISQPAQP